MKITTIGLETWPRAFFRSTAVMRRTRSWFASRFDRRCCHFLPNCLRAVGIEACGTSHHWRAS